MYEVLAVVAAVIGVVGALAGLYVAATQTGGIGDDQLAESRASAVAKVTFAVPFFAGGTVFALIAIAFSVLARS